MRMKERFWRLLLLYRLLLVSRDTFIGLPVFNSSASTPSSFRCTHSYFKLPRDH